TIRFLQPLAAERRGALSYDRPSRGPSWRRAGLWIENGCRSSARGELEQSEARRKASIAAISRTPALAAPGTETAAALFDAANHLRPRANRKRMVGHRRRRTRLLHRAHQQRRGPMGISRSRTERGVVFAWILGLTPRLTVDG